MKKNKKTKKIPPASGSTHPTRKALRLHGSIARDLGVLIVSGRYGPGQILVGEVEASERRKVSRTAYREAVRILAAKGLVHSRPRVGTRVSALEEWHLLDPDVLSWAFQDEPESEVLHGLFELRTIVSLTNGVTAAVNSLTEFKQRIAPLKRDPVPDHLRVYDAIAAKDAEGARAAMVELIRLAIMDTPTGQRPKPPVSSLRALREARP